MTPQVAYDELTQRSKKTALLVSCAEVLGWEEQTYMPAGGVEHRGNQLALLAGLAHQRRTDPRVGELLAMVEGSSLVQDPVCVPAVNTREWRRGYDRATRVPQSLVEELAKTTTTAQRIWADARRQNDFASFAPWLEKIVRLKQQEADALGHNGVRYDALLDEYEPGASTAQVSEVFTKLRQLLVPLVAAIADAKRLPPVEILARDYPLERQKVFGEAAAAAIGFDLHRGRLDETTHPFCSGFGPGDCRITTRYNARHFNEAFFSILHEAGHGMYEQGLPAEHWGTPMGEAVSLGIHESQSRLWENAVGRSRGFWRRFFPWAGQVFRDALRGVSLEQFHFAVNAVQPSLIRVEADEVTYNLHILARFELEQALLAGDLPVGDVPGAWNEKYAEYLGVTPPDDAQGCLQDIHWSAGLVGYFPTYTLGNLYAAQLFAAAAELGDLSAMFAEGDFVPLLEWLRQHVHGHGQRYHSAELVQVATGEPPSHEPLIESLRQKHAELYQLG